MVLWLICYWVCFAFYLFLCLEIFCWCFSIVLGNFVGIWLLFPASTNESPNTIIAGTLSPVLATSIRRNRVKRNHLIYKVCTACLKQPLTLKYNRAAVINKHRLENK